MGEVARNRDFQLVWAGQLLSVLGTRVTGIAVPLLVLAVTGSPARAGIAGFAYTLPILLFSLPAGVVLDRHDRRRLMLSADAARLVALTALAVAVLARHAGFGLIVAVVFVDGAGFTVVSSAERAALPQLVPAAHLPAAAAQIQARENAALLAGQPLGGLLFGLGRAVPFLFDAVTYVFSLLTVLAIRTTLQQPRGPRSQRLRAELTEGLRFLWRQPFLRVTSLLVTGSDFVLNALYLTVIVIAREHHASPVLIGLMLACLGAGGLLGAFLAPALARRLTIQAVVAATMLAPAILVPLLIAVSNPLLLGLIYGTMFVLHPAWDAIVGSYRFMLTPDRIQGRVQSVSILLSTCTLPFGLLAVGFFLQALGSTTTVVTLAVLMACIAACAVGSRAVRAVPPLGHRAQVAARDPREMP